MYRGEQPFHHFLKAFFREHKKHGSGDRRNIAQLCYAYFRLGHSFPGLPVEEKMLRGLFLCSNRTSELLYGLRPEWNERISLTPEEKCFFLKTTTDQLSIFPNGNELSDGIDVKRFYLSHLEQPDLFIRIRPGHRRRVMDKLDKANLPYLFLNDDCIALPNTTKIDTILETNREMVIQDDSSQRIGEMIPAAEDLNANGIISVWDCCAASGGKSIMTVDKLGAVNLTVSDIRESILANLRKRFLEAGINNYNAFVADITKTIPKEINSAFDLIIADVPCSGSGTWGRTPEQLLYFDPVKTNQYSALQKTIVSNIISRLKQHGYLLYTTCSVFKKENEAVVDFIQQQYGLFLVKIEVMKGYENKADTMFAALLQKV